ncbi:MAG: NUDIX hydrolase [Desulfobacteraceae bacterium]|nr:NUDIX hydrolase [Desulfobacteraceae bacterium]
MTEKEAWPFPKNPVLAVGVVVFNDQCVLLVKRGKEPARDEWAIPGGCVNLGETLKQAAEREIREETGIMIQAGEPIFSFEVIDKDETGTVLFHYFIVDLEGEYIEGSIQAGDDAKDARWVSAKDLKTLPLNSATRCLLSEKYGFG